MTTSSPKRVLLTGGTGFIGRHAIASLLERGYEVHAVARDQTRAPSTVPTVRWHRADLMSGESVASLMREVKPNHLLHLAWYTEHGKFWSSVENFAWVKASLDLTREFAASGGRRIVCAGTCAEYDWTDGHCDEATTALRPGTLYGACKNGLREMIEAFACVNGLEFAWGRLFFLYGPHESPARFVPSLILPLLRGEAAACQSGEHVRDFIHTADAADSLVALLDSPVRGAVNIATGSALRLGELARRIASITGRPDAVEIGSRPHTVANPLVLTAGTKRLNDEVGWRPRIELDAGLSEVVSELRRRK